MKLLITGSSGFIGQNVTTSARARGFEVVTLDRVGEADIRRDLLDLDEELPEVDCVVHLAAKADISRNWDNQAERDAIYADNIGATIALLERARTKSFVFISTAAIADGSRSPYVASKIAGEALVQAYAYKHGWSWECLRLVSVVGPGYHHGHIADFVRMAVRDGVVRARTNGRMANPFVHVADVCDAICEGATDNVGDGFAGEGGVTTIAGRLWSWRDTVRVMREMGMKFDVEAGTSVTGWVGDPNTESVLTDYYTKHAVPKGVAAAIESCLARERAR